MAEEKRGKIVQKIITGCAIVLGIVAFRYFDLGQVVRFGSTVAVSMASTIGATLACAVSRFLLRGWVPDKFGDRLARHQ